MCRISFLWIFEKMKKRTTRIIAIALISIYLIGGLLVYFLQEKIMFHPTSLPPDHKFSFDQTYEEMNLPFQGNNLSIVKFKPASDRKGIILFFHGNMDNVERYKNYPAYFLRSHYEVWMIDYPGFGKTTGPLSEKILYEEALTMYDIASQDIHSDSIIIYGKSIGTGIASYTAAHRHCGRLILETPYYSMLSLAKHYFPIYPVNWMIRYILSIHDYLKNLSIPVTIFHGRQDEIVPYHQSEKLKKEIPSIELVTIDQGSHNDLCTFDLFQKKLDSLLH